MSTASAAEPLSLPLTEDSSPVSSSDSSTPSLLHYKIAGIAHFELPPTDLSTPGHSRTSSKSSITPADTNAEANVPQTADPHKTETTSSILRDVGCHQLPFLLSPRPIRRKFARNLDLALRTSASFAVAAVLAIQDWSTDVLGVAYLLPVLSIIVPRPTVGSTVSGIDSQGKGVALAMLLDIVIIATQVGSLGLTNRTIAVELILFFTCIFLGYFHTAPMARRFSLALHSLLMIQLAHDAAPIYLPLQVMFMFVLSYLISLIMTLLPFPRLAKDELLDRYQQVLQSISEVFEELVSAYCETSPITPVVLSSTVQSQLNSIVKSLTVMRRLQAEVAWEAESFSWIFPPSLSLASRLQPKPERVEAVFWILTNLTHTISTQHYSTYHAVFVHYLRPSLLALSRAQSTYLRYLSSTDPSDLSVQRTVELREELDRRMEACWENFTLARRKVYGYDSQHRGIHKANGGDDPAQRVKSRMAVDVEVMQLDDSKAGVVSPSSNVLYHTSREVFTRSCFLFYISRFHLSLKAITEDLSTPSSPDSSSLTSSSHFGRKLRAIRTSMASAMLRPSTWSLFGLHPVKDFWFLLCFIWAWLHKPTVEVAWLKNSIKMALIVCIAALLALIPSLQSSSVFPNALWAAFTASILASETEGALWQRGIQRLLGTVVGGVIGYLILLAFPDNYGGSIPLLVLWNLPMQFIVISPSYAYLGALATFTPIIIVFGFSTAGEGLTLERFALARMLEIVIGVAIALALSSVLWPVSSIRLLRSEMILSCDATKQSIHQTSDIYDRMAVRYHSRQRRRQAQSTVKQPEVEELKARRNSVSDSQAQYTLTIHKEEGERLSGMMEEIAYDIHQEDALLQSLVSTSHSVQMSLSRQERLLGEASHEPATFFYTFPVDSYQRLASTQRRIWCLVLTLEPALRCLLEEQWQHQRRTAGDEEMEELFNVPVLGAELQRLVPQMLEVLSACSVGLQSGCLMPRAGMRGISTTVQKMEGAFADSMNDLAQRVREGKTAMMRSQAIVPLAVFLYSAAQLVEQVLTLEAQVRRMLELERPQGYDD